MDGDEIRFHGGARVDVQTVDDDLEGVKESVDQRKRGGGHLSVRNIKEREMKR